MHLFGGFVIGCVLTCTCLRICHGTDPPGHQQPLGAHLPPLGITLIGKFSSPGVFYEHFVKLGNPILMKQPLVDAKYPAMMKWNDYYLREKYGDLTVLVEKSKKERRYQEATAMTLVEFLNIYRRDDVYMVQRVHKQMMDDVHVPYTLQCGGFQRVLQDAVVWFSSGNTRSVLHFDALDNLLCVLDGKKDVLLINKTQSHLVEADGFDKDELFSTVDVDSVNMRQFPRLQTVPWFQAHLQAGDCLYIPFRWYHQVKSAPGRNLAVNIWFSHLWSFDHSDCDREFNLTVPLSSLGFASSNEPARSSILEIFSGMAEVSRSDFLRVLSAENKQLEELFALMDRNKDSVLTWKELYRFNIDEAVRQFPEVFHNSSRERERKKAESIKLKSEELEENVDEDNLSVDITNESENDTKDSHSQIDDKTSPIHDKESEIGDKESQIGDKQSQIGDKTIELDDKIDDIVRRVDDKIQHDDVVPSELKSSIKVTVRSKDEIQKEKKAAEKKRDGTSDTQDSPSRDSSKRDEL